MPFTPIHMGPGILIKALLQPFYPLILTNTMQGIIPVWMLHKVCLYSGLVGAVIYYLVMVWRKP